MDSTLLFGRDRAQLRPGASRRLRQVGDQIAAQGPGRVTITGYTDDLGSRAHGRTLSRQRADTVADLLRERLPTSDHPFTVRGRGEDAPAVPNTSEANRRLNRRVIIGYAPTR